MRRSIVSGDMTRFRKITVSGMCIPASIKPGVVDKSNVDSLAIRSLSYCVAFSIFVDTISSSNPVVPASIVSQKVLAHVGSSMQPSLHNT